MEIDRQVNPVKNEDRCSVAGERRDCASVSLPLSVVIPVRNSPAQLKVCLEALLKNRLDEIEILVVDDASSDETPDVAAALAGEIDVPLRLLRLERRLGPAAARNAGMRAACNRHVLFLDADIVLPEHAIQSLMETVENNAMRPEIAGAMGVYSEQIPWTDYISDYKNLHVCFLHQTTETLSPYLHTPILCINRDVLEAEGGFDSSLETAEDFRMGVKLGSKGYRFIMDRRVQGTHLKRLSVRALLKEDWRRVRDLLSIQLGEREQKFIYRAHRLSRLLSAALPLPTLALSGVAVWIHWLAWVAAPLWIGFGISNQGFLRYVWRRRNLLFALKAYGMMFIEMLWAQLALIYWTLQKMRRRFFTS